MSIEKKIHLIWLGGNKPTKFEILINKIKEINFDYQILEWNENNIDFELINQKIFDSCENLGAKSDILRFELLYRYGGIYMDYDFLQIKKFDDILDCDFFAGSPYNDRREIWNSIVGSVPKNDVCEFFLNEIKKIKTPILKNEIDRVMLETGPELLRNIINNNVFKSNMKLLIGNYFYPFPAIERHSIRELSNDNLEYVKTFIKPETICIHLHTTTWQ